MHLRLDLSALRLGRDCGCDRRPGQTPLCRAVLVTLCLAWLLATSAYARDEAVAIRGKVTHVRDGDTLQMLTDAGHRIEVRLNAIDAPEKAHSGSRGQPHAERSRINLAELVLRRHATLMHTTMDRYGRHVGTLLLESAGGTIDAGWWQVKSGYAWVYERYLDELPPALRVRYREAQSEARDERRGLWADARPVPPWDWRRRQSRS